MLAKTGPDGKPTNGITRTDYTQLNNPVPYNDRFDHFAWYAYWPYEEYLNIWLEPLPASTIDQFLGLATGPLTDLPGYDSFLKGEPDYAEGVLINNHHFGETSIDSEHNLGRTLTHEIGHYLGLMHPWGVFDCETNDYCDDTPPVDRQTSGCPDPVPLACDGTRVMIENFMDYSADSCLNIFTNDQVERMHYVLSNTPARKALLTSPGLTETE